MLRLTLSFGITMLLTALPARADEVRLKNGDRLTGEAISLANGTLTFKTALGELRIPWGDVTSLAVDKAVFVTVGSNPPILTAFAAADPVGYVTLMPGGRVLLTDIAALMPQLRAWEVVGDAQVRSVPDEPFLCSGIRFSLAAGFVATIQENVDYDRRPSPGRRQTDRTFSLTLGYQF